MFWVRRFPNLFVTSIIYLIYLCKEVDICDTDIYIFILPWFLEQRKLIYTDIGICSISYCRKKGKIQVDNKVMVNTQKALVKIVTLSLSLKWPLNYILSVFPSKPHT